MTPKTLDKYIAALKKKAAAEGWTQAEYEAAVWDLHGEMADQLSDGKISQAEYDKALKQIENAKNNMALLGKASAQKTKAMTEDEKDKLLHDLQTKAINHEISKSDADKLMYKVSDLYGKGASAEDAKKLLDKASALIKKDGLDADDALAAAESKSNAPAGMTHPEYIGLWEALNKKKKAGLITQDEYKQLGTKLDKAYQNKKSLQDTQKEIGCDAGTLATDDQVIKLEKELRKVYQQAANELKDQLDGFVKKYGPEIKKLEMDFINGTISAEDLKWMQAKLLQKKILEQKVDQMTGTLLDANKKAMGMVNGEQLNVFADNANYQSFQITKDAGIDLMFSVYDESTAAKLLKEKPELLPRKVVNGKKDKAWNQKQISAAVLQAVIQGESIPKLAKRIAMQTASTNMNAMIRYARTAMTGAQNAGRMEMLHRAQGMGIKVRKTWLATLDGRTRDSHQHMDGTTVGVDEKFPNGLMFPGDPNGPPGEVYNCRCTLIYQYDDFPADPAADQRRDQTTGQMIQNMTYVEWKAAKEGSQLNALNYAKRQLAEAQKKVVAAKIDENKVYSGIWKDDVTLKDYPDKKGSIQAKRDYYTDEIQKFKDAQAQGKSWATDDKIKDLQKKLKALNDFEKKGQLIEDRDKAIQAVQDVYQKVGFGKTVQAPAVMKAPKKAQNKAKKAASASGGGTASGTPAHGQNAAQGKAGTPFSPDAYSKERLDKALWTTDQRKVDSVMRARTGEVWSGATQAEREAIYEYTMSYSKFNEPLRGIEYGSNSYKGVGNTDLDAGHRHNGKRLNAMTDIIDKCSYDHDMWLQRSTGTRGMDKFFQCSSRLLELGTQKELEQELLGKTVTEYGFMSMGSAKGKGFSGEILLNIYAPSGTKMMYAEPFSAYSGSSNHLSWDGKEKQSHFGGEFETIMQQNTQFRVAKVERSGRKIYVDLHVIGQGKPQRWTK